MGSFLAEVDFRASDLELGSGRFDRHIREHKFRHAFGVEAVGGVHRDAVAVRVDQFFVDPISRRLGQTLDVDFACADHHLPVLATDGVAIDVHVREIVVNPDRLDL